MKFNQCISDVIGWCLVVLSVQLLGLGGAFAGTFTIVGAMTTNRYDHTATLLPNGKVLVAGGRHTT